MTLLKSSGIYFFRNLFFCFPSVETPSFLLLFPLISSLLFLLLSSLLTVVFAFVSTALIQPQKLCKSSTSSITNKVVKELFFFTLSSPFKFIITYIFTALKTIILYFPKKHLIFLLTCKMKI